MCVAKYHQHTKGTKIKMAGNRLPSHFQNVTSPVTKCMNSLKPSEAKIVIADMQSTITNRTPTNIPKYFRKAPNPNT